MKPCELSAAWRSHHNPASPWEHGYKDAHAIDLDAALAPVVALAEEWKAFPGGDVIGISIRAMGNELLVALGKKVSET